MYSFALTEHANMKILVVDDNEVNVRLLASMLRRRDYEVVEANNGYDAIDIFKHELPDLVLMDIMMPGMDGRECATQLKRISGDIYIPIIYVTALSQDAALSTALSAGGDDFVSKPINFDILLSKIGAHRRIQELNNELAQKNAQLAQYNLALERDQELATHFFEQALKNSYLEPSIIRHHLSSASAFNGDLLLSAPRPGGGIYVMLGDFTGHGLGASIGSLPVAQTFYNMTKNTCWIGDIAKELNREIRELMPDDMFLAATLVELNSTGKHLAVWAGGLPEAYLIDPHTHTQRIIKSAYPPLGILADDSFNPATDSYTVANGERLYLYTDGVIEAKNLQGQLYGSKRLHSLFLEHETDAFNQIIGNVQAFVSQENQTDDISFVELTCQPVHIAIDVEAAADIQNTLSVAVPYSLTIRLTDKELKNETDVVSCLSEMICSTNLAPYKGIIHTILSEIYSNMLEHGLLDLQSEQKYDEDGFAAYYEQKNNLLKHSNDLLLEINISYEPELTHNKLAISMAHNGKPANSINSTHSGDTNTEAYGRGMLLLTSLCEDVNFYDEGRKVEVVYLA